MADGMTATAEPQVSDANLSTPETPAPQKSQSEPTTTQSPETPAGISRFLKKELQSHELATKYGSASDLFEAHLTTLDELEKAKTFPAADAPDEEWDAYRASHGRPEKPEDYRLPELPKEIATNAEGYEDWFKSTMHAIGADQRMAEQFFQKTVERAQSQLEAATKSQKDRAEEQTRILQAEWGDNYQGNLDLAKRAFKTFAGEKAAKRLEELGLLVDAETIMMFSKIGDAISEETLVGGRPDSAGKKLKDINPATGRRGLNL